nr:hypothetical protein [uncultured Methanospirillum sp.]
MLGLYPSLRWIVILHVQNLEDKLNIFATLTFIVRTFIKYFWHIYLQNKVARDTSTQPKPLLSPVTPELISDALRVIRSGKVLETFREVYKTLHSGDQEICDIITISGAVGAAKTTKGIQPGFSGHKGAGKTSGSIASLHLWPEEYVISGGLSNKALFYRENILPGSVVFSDDTYLQEDLMQAIKAAMSSYQQGSIYFTVGKVGGVNTGIEKRIPERTTFIFTSIDDTGDAELADRQYKLSLNPDQYQKQGRIDFFLSRMEEGREELPITPGVILCRQILRQIKEHIFRVHMPFARRLKFSNLDNMRDTEQLVDFIQGITILNYPNRSPITDEDGITTLQATEEDFFTAMTIFKSADDTREFKLTKNERGLLDWLCENHRTDGMPESKIVSDFGGPRKIPRTSCRRLLYGKDGDGGICSKVPGVFMQKETRPTERDRDCKTITNVIFVNPALKTTLDNFGQFCILMPEKQEVSKDNNPGPGNNPTPDITPPEKAETSPKESPLPDPPKEEIPHFNVQIASEEDSPPLKESPGTYSEWLEYHQMPADTRPDDYGMMLEKADRKGHVCHCKGCTEPQRSNPLYWNIKMPKYARTRICQPHHNEMITLWNKEHPEGQL